MDPLSSVKIREFQESNAASWDTFVSAHPRGSFFHQSSWKRVIERTFGFEARYVYAERGGRITGVAPLFSISNWMVGHCLISVPFAVYGGICAEEANAERALLSYLKEMAVADRVDYLELRNRDGGVADGFLPVSRYATFSLPLHSDPDALLRSFPKDIRYSIRKAERAELYTRRGPDQLDDFYQLFSISMRRLGTPVFPRTLFENLVAEYPTQVDLMLVYSKSQPVAGAMSLLFHDAMQPYYVGSTMEARALMANDFMWWELIKYAAQRGLRRFDFGRSKKGTGAFAFKMKWKPQVQDLDYQVYLVRRKTSPNFSPANPKFNLATQVWQRMPLGLTRLLGPRVVRWFP